MYLGVDYYPEQWDPSLLEEDLDNICELGCNAIRIAEFGWHLMEPAEGQYDFSFFDHVIERAKVRGLSIVMGTPTATIPAWLAKKHPDILSEFEDGTKRVFGGRHVYCFNSPTLYRYAEGIIRAMAEHYKGEKAIVAWQIDNEFGHEDSDICWCPQCRDAFQAYLKEKFHGNIGSLNDAYGTVFWSQTYNDFGEIPLPARTITTHNPALRLDWERFRSESIVKFAAFQARLLREIIPGVVEIHDFPGGGLGKHADYSAVSKHLDVAAYNNYPVWGGQPEPLPPNEIAFGLDYIRGLKQRNFWITEAIMGAQGHDITGFSPRPNQAKMWAYQAMARGCESLFFFRYRGATKGAEQFCYGVLDPDNVKRRKFYEVQSFFRDIRQYASELETPITSQVAIVYDYDSLAAFRIQRQSELLDCEAEMKKYHKFFYDRNVPVDVIPADRDLTGYQVVILPQMIIAKPDFQRKLRDFAQRGGTVVLTYRDFVKDPDNNLVLGKQLPIDFTDFAGVCVAETESLQEGQKFPVTGEGNFAGVQGQGGIFRDMLEVHGADVLLRYHDAFYQEFAAVTRKAQKDGWVYDLGCGLEESVLDKILEEISVQQNLPLEDSAAGVEVICRGTGEDRVRMVINHNAQEAVYDGKPVAPFQCWVEPAAE
ncbi:beta-galactosidase [Dysosmobacter sp.]|uniref:beta-galactosidase n=1 Tax=Dysosmobacter sp. TaxID=2591382 RepID=UPI003FD7F3E4